MLNLNNKKGNTIKSTGAFEDRNLYNGIIETGYL